MFSTSQTKAAEAFVQVAYESLHTNNATTVIAGASRMAGTFLFRSFGFQFDGAQPGSVALSEEANEKGPRLMQTLGGVLEHLGIHVGPSLVESDGENDTPSLDFLTTQNLLEPGFDKVRRENELSFEDAALAVAAAVAFLIQHYQEVIDKDVAFGVAVYGFIEGTKTIPLPMPEAV